MLCASGIEIPRTLAEAVDRHRTALLVYDMQVGILRQMPEGAAVTEKAGAVLDAARAVGLRTFFMRHTSLPKKLMGRFQMRQALAWQRTDDPKAVFDKLMMSAFAGTPLDFALRDCDIRTLLICGVATEIGIEPTVRHAADLGYLPIVVEDACGAGHAEAGARALDSLRFMGDALFTTVDEITALLHEEAAAPPAR